MSDLPTIVPFPLKTPFPLTDWHVHVLMSENLLDWKIVQAADGYCWCTIKTIQLPVDATHSLFLHEVAHAKYQEPEGPMKNHYHGGEWAAEFGRLVDTYTQIHI